MSRTVVFERGERIYESDHSLIYRARRSIDGQPVMLKQLEDPYPSPEQIGWFEREYHITRRLDGPGVVAMYELVQLHGCWTMVLEDFGGHSLDVLGRRGRHMAGGTGGHAPGKFGTWTMDEFLSLAIAITGIVDRIHKKRVIHKDINPSNIVRNPRTGAVKLIDFGISALLPQEKPAFGPPAELAGTLAYIPPEQTGRMNRGLDYRADFYSLGVTFYEIVTGTLPFSAADGLELIHAHIARMPDAPHRRRLDVPLALSDVIMKLLAKNAEDRYQSASGLLTDLETIAREWRSREDVTRFVLGQRDVSDRFRILHKLYGRDREIARLMAALEQVSDGGCQLLLVAGVAGIGKSALVHEVHKPITGKHGYFIAGKFDQLQRDVPHGAVLAAFRELVRQILTESAERVARWKQRLVDALGGNARVITDVVPEVELIIGPESRPAVPELSPGDAENRFNTMFQRFIAVFTRPEHPLVLFLDDLQWADEASLRLIRRLTSSPQAGPVSASGPGPTPAEAADTGRLLVIGAYRSDEITDAHPLRRLQEDLEASGNPARTIALSALTHHDIALLLGDTLHVSVEEVAVLAEVIAGKTGGNAFFVTELVKALHKQAMIVFDHDRARWVWDLEAIRAHDATGNVVDLMTGRIRHLGARAQRVLRLAACIGNRFDLEILATIADQSAKQTADDLWDALTGGLVVPVGDGYKLVGEVRPARLATLRATYRFAHDRVQEAAYSLIPPTERPGVHARIGRLWRDRIPPAQRGEYLFDIVNQLNLGRVPGGDGSGNPAEQPGREERLGLAELNVEAGRRARASAAYGAAWRYLEAGVAWAPDDVWERAYELALSLYIEAAEAAYLCGEFDRARHHIDWVLSRATSLLDKVKSYEVLIQLLIADNQPSSACDVAFSVLEMLDIRLLGALSHSPSDRPGVEREIQRQLERLRAILAEHVSGDSIEELVDKPETDDPVALAAMRILATMLTPVSYTRPRLLCLVAFQMIELFVTRGKCPLSAFGCVYYGAWLCGQGGDVATGYRFGKLALALMERDGLDELRAKVYGNYTFFVRHWKEHAGEDLPRLLEAYQSGLEAGDLEFAGYCVYSYCWHQHGTGKPIGRLLDEVGRYSPVIRDQLGQEMTFHRNEMLHQILANLHRDDGDPERACHVSGDHYDEDVMIPAHLAANHQTIFASFHYNKLLLHYLFGLHERGLASAEIVIERIDCMVGGLEIPIFYFHDCLNRLAICLAAVREGRAPGRAHLARIEATRERIAGWAEHAEANHRHRFYLVEAEYAQLMGDPRDAREYYDAAASLAHARGYLNEQAMAYERAAGFYAARDADRLAAHYLREAHYAYEQWGARAKMKHLEERHPQLSLRRTGSGTRTSRTVGFETGSRDYGPGALDVLSIIKASQAISSELELDRLLARLIALMIENAGAQRGVLALARGEALLVEATHSVHDEVPRVLQSIPVEHCASGGSQASGTGGDIALAVEVVQYVARSRERVVLADGVLDERFGHLPHVQGCPVRSLLCVPLVSHGRLIGVVYLENNLAANVFTADRVDVVSLLGTQASISIENARAVAARAEQERMRLVQERLQMENELLEQQSGELSRLNADKDRFFAIISHDLRSPFHTMSSEIGILRDELRKRGDSELTRRAESAYRAAKVTFDLLENLLSWSRLQRGQMVFEPRDVELEPLASGVVAVFRQRAEAKGIDLRHHVPPGIRARGDKNMVETVLRNLTSNALKFTRTGGRVVISAHRPPVNRAPESVIGQGGQETGDSPGARDGFAQARVSARASARSVAIAVRDTGVGIAPGDLERLFRIDVHHTTPGTDDERGTGLGLILCHEMVRQNHGAMRVDSEPGRGTEVVFTLPLVALPAGGVAAMSASEDGWSSMAGAGGADGRGSGAEGRGEAAAGLAPVVAPGSEQLEALWRQAMMGDVSAIKKQVAALEASDPALGPFARAVGELVATFEIERILALIERYR